MSHNVRGSWASLLGGALGGSLGGVLGSAQQSAQQGYTRAQLEAMSQGQLQQQLAQQMQQRTGMTEVFVGVNGMLEVTAFGTRQLTAAEYAARMQPVETEEQKRAREVREELDALTPVLAEAWTPPEPYHEAWWLRLLRWIARRLG